jgi:UDP-N-acetylglucosamine:LPS N-acetylglucosamine transferase
MGQTVLFITSNGAGLGHLTRAMAVARRLPEGIKPIVFTLSQGAPIVREQGFFVEYLPSADYLEGGQAARWATRVRWNTLFRERLLQILDLYEPAVVVFDGTYPYNGLIEVIEASPKVHWIWCRRAMWRPGLGKNSLVRTEKFDLVVEPGEFAAEADAGLTAERRHEARQVAPICYLDRDELLPREAAEAELGLEPGRLHVFMQLGAGNINDISSAVGMCVRRFQADPRVQLVFAESSIAGRAVNLPAGVVKVRGYPLARFFNAFDVAVSAAGYNTFHELIGYGVPSLFIPNADTALDDQVARARWAEAQGLGFCWEDSDGAGLLSEKIGRLLDDEVRVGMRGAMVDVAFENGAGVVADLLVTSVTSPSVITSIRS